jgi:N-acetylglucosaminyldiphosphoundecaprenol N-acetyl-beta-D-mannosaminyltransferase
LYKIGLFQECRRISNIQVKSGGIDMYEQISVLGTPLSLCDQKALLDTIGDAILRRRKMLVLSGNVYSYNLAYENASLRAFFNQADIVRLDGEGVRWGAKLLGFRTPPRMTWADFAWDLAEYAEQHSFTLFFLGAKPGIAQNAASRLKEHSPNLKFVGIQHGYFDRTSGCAENEAVIEQINVARPNILVIGFGMPVQERWLMENRERIDADVVLTGGAVFDYISGELRRGPRLLTDHGFEWLARLLIEPRRLWKRYIIGNPVFFWRVLKQRFGLLRFKGD